MSRKDYRAIASAVRTAHVTGNTVKLDVLIRELAALSADNPRFDSDAFAQACGQAHVYQRGPAE